MQYEFREKFEYNGKKYDVKAHTKRELRQKVARRMEKARAEAPLINSDMTVRAWGEYAIEVYKTNQKPITRKKFLNRVRHCIFEEIGSMRLSAVKSVDCQMVLNKQIGKSKTQINEVYNAMRFIFDKAIANRLLTENPMLHTTKPAGSSAKRRALTDEERELVRKVIPKKKKYMLYRLMLDLGLRPSEAAEAKGSDIVLRSGIPMLHVRGTKTANAERFIPIPKDLLDDIKKTPKSAFIASYDGGGKITEGNRARVWQSFRRDMNVELGAKMYRNQLLEDLVAPDLVPYCFRHDYCSRLAAAGVDIRTAQKIMGHSSIELTASIYTHINDDALLEAARLME